MTTKISDEMLGRFARKQSDWFRGVRGGTLDPDEVIQAVQQIIDRSPALQRPIRQEGWELVENVEERQPLSLRQLEPISFLLKGENYVNGEELVERAKKMQASFGQRQAEYLLDHQDEIPEEWRQYYPVFTGTIWRDPSGRHFIPCLGWDGRRWSQPFSWLDFGFGSRARLLGQHD